MRLRPHGHRDLPSAMQKHLFVLCVVKHESIEAMNVKHNTETLSKNHCCLGGGERGNRREGSRRITYSESAYVRAWMYARACVRVCMCAWVYGNGRVLALV